MSAAQPAFRRFVRREHLPGEGVVSRPGFAAFVRQFARSAFHPAGTCRMGGHADSVVDPKLRVRGIEGLRVCDNSVMPRLISSNTNAVAIMIAEKAADLSAEASARRIEGVVSRAPAGTFRFRGTGREIERCMNRGENLRNREALRSGSCAAGNRSF